MAKLLLYIIVFFIVLSIISYGFSATFVLLVLAFSSLWAMVSSLFYMIFILLILMCFYLIVTGGNRKV